MPFRYVLKVGSESWDVEAPTRGGSDGLWIFTHRGPFKGETMIGAAAVLSLEPIVLNYGGRQDDGYCYQLTADAPEYEAMVLEWDEAATTFVGRGIFGLHAASYEMWTGRRYCSKHQMSYSSSCQLCDLQKGRGNPCKRHWWPTSGCPDCR